MAVPTTSTTSINLSVMQTKFVHPTFSVLQPIWQKLRDVREGTGGFIDGSYLVAHPREWDDYIATNPKKPTKKFKARRALASYENFAATIIESMKAAVCREQPVRRVGDPTKPSEVDSPIELWWENVDGNGTHIDDFMAMVWDIAATFGHVYLYLDRAKAPPATAIPDAGGVATEPYPATAADETMPFLRVYTPLDVWDWLTDDVGELTAVKFAELSPRLSLDEPWLPQIRVRTVDETGWKLYAVNSISGNQSASAAGGTLVDGGEHKMGILPVVVLYAARRPLEPQVGQSVLGDPKLYIDLYNLQSEVRELLRNQTFGILNVPVGTGDTAPSLEDARAMTGTVIGTDNVLYSAQPANFISPPADNVVAYHDEMSRKLRVIYRLCSLAWESDRRGAEAEGALQIKKDDMNQRLAGYADEMERADYKLACLFYRATQGADVGEQQLENDDVQIKYPDSFDLTPFDKVLEQAQAAMNLGMPAFFLKQLRKQLARKFDGMTDAPQQILDKIDEAIDSAPDDLSPNDQARLKLEATTAALKGAPAKGAAPVKGAQPPALAKGAAAA